MQSNTSSQTNRIRRYAFSKQVNGLGICSYHLVYTDVILGGMDLLSKNNVIIDCNKKKMYLLGDVVSGKKHFLGGKRYRINHYFSLISRQPSTYGNDVKG